MFNKTIDCDGSSDKWNDQVDVDFLKLSLLYVDRSWFIDSHVDRSWFIDSDVDLHRILGTRTAFSTESGFSANVT